MHGSRQSISEQQLGGKDFESVQDAAAADGAGQATVNSNGTEVTLASSDSIQVAAAGHGCPVVMP